MPNSMHVDGFGGPNRYLAPDRSRAWRSIFATAALATCTALAVANHAALAQTSEEWIVIGSDAAEASLQEFDANFAGQPDAPEFDVVESQNGLTIVRIDPEATGLIQNVVHLDFRRCGGYTVHPTRESALQELNNPIYQPGFVHSTGVFPVTLDEQSTVTLALSNIDSAEIIKTIQALQDLKSRHYQSPGGEQSAAVVAQLWNDYAAGRDDVTVERIDHDWAQDSVVASVQGSVYPDEIVIIGGHLDSIHNADNRNAPGADDNASGIAVVSEVLRVLLMELDWRPERTVQFMAYAAEEVGLRGSGAIAGEYAGAARKVVGVLQLDMTGFRGSDRDMYFVTDFVNPHVTAFLQALIAEYNSAGVHAITYGETACGYGCSDHASWTKEGYPAAFPFEAEFSGANRKIHSPQDLVTNLDSTGVHQTRFAKLAAEFAIELAGVASLPK